jgi:hypothetical protein
MVVIEVNAESREMRLRVGEVLAFGIGFEDSASMSREDIA